MLNICSLFSGSSGNCTFIESEDTCVLLDAGVSMKRIFSELDRIGKSSHDIKAIFVTHEHTDHILSVGALTRKLNIPVFATEGTLAAMSAKAGKIERELIRPVRKGETVSLGGLAVTAFSIPHDAAEPVGYTFAAGDKKLTVATDIGAMDDGIFLSLSGSDAVLLESNHDVEMLMGGGYPYYLKKRIRGRFGHLSNEEAGAVCARLAAQGTKTFLLGHLSAENNSPQKVMETASGFVLREGVKPGRDIFLEVLERGKQGKLITV